MDNFYFNLALIIILYIFTKRLLHNFQNLLPTPFPSLPIIGHLYLLKKPLHRTLRDLSARFGPILLLRFGSRSVLVVSSPSAAEECLSKNDVVFANRPHLLTGKYLGYNYTSLVWAPYGDHWRNLRRITSIEILSSNRLQLLAGIRADEVQLLVRRLVRSSDQTVDLKSAFFGVTLNVLMRMIAGKRYYGENVESSAAERFRATVADTFRVGGATNMADYLPVLRWVGSSGSDKWLKELQERRDGFMQELVEEKKRTRIGDLEGEGKKTKTMIEVLLKLQEKEPENYSDEIIRGIMLVLLTAGSDTSAGTMEWAFSLLLNHQEVLKKAQAEIDSVTGGVRIIEESDLASLPYLRCIINETMRMYPAGPLLVPHESSEESMVGGFRVPRGTMLLVNLWTIQNDPEIWVEPRKFRPERFEGLEGVRDGFKLMPFGSGRRGCPGEGLALRVVGLTLGSLIQCFDWERPSENMVDMTEGAGLTLPKAQPLIAKCRPRPAMAQLLSQI